MAPRTPTHQHHHIAKLQHPRYSGSPPSARPPCWHRCGGRYQQIKEEGRTSRGHQTPHANLQGQGWSRYCGELGFDRSVRTYSAPRPPITAIVLHLPSTTHSSTTHVPLTTVHHSAVLPGCEGSRCRHQIEGKRFDRRCGWQPPRQPV